MPMICISVQKLETDIDVGAQSTWGKTLLPKIMYKKLTKFPTFT